MENSNVIRMMMKMRWRIKVLKDIQPATRKAWEKACWDDFQKRGWLCLSIDMDISLGRCVSHGFVVETDGLLRLAPGQRKLWAAWRNKCDTYEKEQDSLENERRHDLMEWIDTKSDRAIRMALRRLARCETYADNGYRVWENLEAMLR